MSHQDTGAAGRLIVAGFSRARSHRRWRSEFRAAPIPWSSAIRFAMKLRVEALQRD
jgi:hypothetical protein